MSEILAERPLALPPIRSDLESARADLDEFGLTRVAMAASPAAIAEARNRLIEQAAGEMAAGIAHCDPGYTTLPGEGAANQRLWNLLNKGAIFREFVLNETALALARHLLGPDLLLFSITANIARLGGTAQKLHGDQLFSPPETPYPLIANSLWMLDDFTEENGATRVVPRTQRAMRWPDPDAQIETVAATGPAGTLLVWDGRLWHGTGANRTDTPRHGLISAYGRPFLRPQENHTVSVSPEVLAESSPELLALLGFAPWLGIGMIDGKLYEPQAGRPMQYSRELSAAGN